MKSNNVINAALNTMYANAKSEVAALAEIKASAVKSALDKTAEEGIAIVNGIVNDINAVIRAVYSGDIMYPNCLIKVTYTGDDISVVNVSVRSKLKAPYKYSRELSVNVDDNFVIAVGDLLVDALYEMLCIELAVENVNDLNEKVATIVAENDIPYSVAFAVDNNDDAMVLEITDKSIVFNASIQKAHEISNLSIFQSGDEYSDYVSETAVAKLAEALKAIQTPVQLIKGNIQLIADVTDITTKKRASKIIRGAYHRQTKYLGGVKAGVGYFNEDVTINGETVEVFALVEKNKEGNLEVVLKPFDVKTLLNVDFDVLSAVKAQLA